MVVRARLLAPLALLVAACSPAWEARPVTAVFDPSGDGFWSLPLPSDLRRDEDGRPGLRSWPGVGGLFLVSMWLEAADARLVDGWGLTSGVFVTTTGDLDPSSLPADPAASLEPDSSVQLVDIDPDSPERGRRFPLEVSFRARGDRYAPSSVLTARPVFGFVRRPKTLYALIVTDAVRDAEGRAIGASEVFYRGLEGEGDPRVVAHLAPLAAFLDPDARRRVAVAAVFRTLDPNAGARRLADFAEQLPGLEPTNAWRVLRDHADYRVLSATVAMPVVQSGERPYTREGHGRIVFGSDGRPVVQSHQPVEVVVAIPKQPMQASGYPVTMYLHGSGGNRLEALDRGPLPEDRPRREQGDGEPGEGPAAWLARKGIATVSFDFGLHGLRHDPPDTTGLQLYNLLGNVEATIDNFTVAIMELVLWSRFVESVRIPGGLLPPDSNGGEVWFDGRRLGAMGQSMGTTLGLPWATVDPRLDAIVLSGAGGMLVEIAVTAVQPLPLKGPLEISLGLEAGQLHIDHPLLHALQNLWDLVDPVAKGRHLVLEPHPGVPAKHALMFAGVRDGYFHPRSQAAFAAAIGAPLAGASVEPILPAVLALDGRAPVAYPVQANVGGMTLAVVQADAPNTQGHYIAFNHEGARTQYACFLAGLGRTAAPTLLAPQAFVPGGCPGP